MTRSFEVGCTVDVSHTFENLYAHVELDGGIQIHPGDRVLVHGPPLHPPFGHAACERRTATVTRATWFERAWLRFLGNFNGVTLLDDVGFTDRDRREQ